MSKLIQIGKNLNAYKISFDEALLHDLRNVYISTLSEKITTGGTRSLFKGGKPVSGKIWREEYRFNVMSYGKHPLLWVSNDNMHTYELFLKYYNSLDINEAVKKLVDYDKRIIMYCGFFVVGDRLDEPVWHVDYFQNANAYTLITPLFEPDTSHGNLLYKDACSSICTHQYKTGEAVVFGDGFYHTTEVYERTKAVRVLLSLTFGTDKPEHWDVMKRTIGGQSDFMILPCGHQRGTCHCMDDSTNTTTQPGGPDSEKSSS